MQKLVRIMLIILFGLTFLVVSIRVLVRTSNEPHDSSFSDATVLIGQPISAVVKEEVLCQVESGGFDDQAWQRCVLEREKNNFSEIVVISVGGIIRQFIFTPREGAILIGHLILLWGEPEVQRFSRSVYLNWYSQRTIALVPNETEPISVSQPVHRVYVLDSSPLEIGIK